VNCGPKRESTTDCWRVAEFELGCDPPGPFGIDTSNPVLLNPIRDCASALVAIDCTDDMVDPSEIEFGFLSSAHVP
jgi:hypothetical protein